MMFLSIVEFRQYTLHGGRRDELIRLFESTFVEPQNSVGARVLATFRDLDDPDRFVWMRGFANMDARKHAIDAFYDGAVWKAHRDAANATMLDSDNVLLLRRAAATTGMSLPEYTGTPGEIIRVTISYLGAADGEAFSRFFETTLRAQIENHGADILGSYVTETTPNDVRLPIRENENVFLWLARFKDQTAERDFADRHAKLSGWRDDAPSGLLPAFMRKPEILRLSATKRSPVIRS